MTLWGQNGKHALFFDKITTILSTSVTQFFFSMGFEGQEDTYIISLKKTLTLSPLRLTIAWSPRCFMCSLTCCTRTERPLGMGRNKVYMLERSLVRSPLTMGPVSAWTVLRWSATIRSWTSFTTRWWELQKGNKRQTLKSSQNKSTLRFIRSKAALK